MEEQINIWPFIRSLIFRWPWVLGSSILAAGTTFVIITLLPATYESTALIAVTSPEILTLESLTIQNLDPRFQTEPVANPYLDIYPELAISDTIVKELLSRYSSRLDNIDSPEELRDLLSVQVENESSILRFTVINKERELARDIANSWVNLFMLEANNLLDFERGQKLAFFEQQLAQANTNLLAAELELTQFQSQNRIATINNSLNILLHTQAHYFEQQAQLRLLMLDVTALQNHIVDTNISTVTTADQLTALFLQLRTFDVDFSNPSLIQISLDEALTGTNRQAHIDFLNNLHTTLEVKSEQLAQLIEALEPEVLRLQEQKQEAEIEQSKRMRQLSSSEETYTALVRRVTEERISSEEPANATQLISEPTLPTKPIGSNRLLNTAIAGAVTFLAASFLIVGHVWWQQSAKKYLEANNE